VNSGFRKQDAKKIRQRLLREKRLLGTWRAVADKYEINVSYIYNFALKGRVPANSLIRTVLGFPAQNDIPPKLLDTRQRNAARDAIARMWGYRSASEFWTCMIELYKDEL